MYIKSMVIDGFKSYAQRTEINGFDPLFNAITGLNGSGKSNILDAICFLLGITNLTQVRATGLQELVYKSGQAGVTKATVSITFDNTDKDQSPLGYEQYEEITVTRQVVIGGRNKYLINGSNANNTRVQDMFRSVQLNVNNPHFLIMQGRITKVLNMKPLEILSMVEEAAGTKLYESKKETAQKTIEKKDAKLKEIETILREEITPTLTRLKDERSSYLEYQKIMRELEHLNKLCLAYRFVCALDTKQISASKLQEMEEQVKLLSDRCKEIQEKVKVLMSEVNDLEKKRDQEAGGLMKKLEEAVTEKDKEEAKAASNVNYKKEAIKAEHKKIKDIKKHQTADSRTLNKRSEEKKQQEAERAKLLVQSQRDQEACDKAQAHFEAVSAGLLSSEDGQDASLNGQLQAAKAEISNIDTETKSAESRLKHSKQDIKKKEDDIKKTEQGYAKDEKVLKAATAEVAKIENELSKLNYEEGNEEQLEAQRKQLAAKVQKFRDKVETLEARLPHLKFDFKDPEKNFDRGKVPGIVAKLLHVKDVRYATSIEVTAGGKLYNVVVDTEETGSKILTKGELRRRVTFIPLNKISGSKINNDIVKRAENLVGKENVHTALSLVGYDSVLEPAMRYVLGTAFVCSDINTAKKVAFDERIMKRTVTLDGDSFDPAGTLSGGARKQTSSVLQQLSEFHDAEQSLQESSTQLSSVQRQLGNIRNTAARWADLKQRLDLKQNEAQTLQARLQQSSHGQQLQEIEEMRKVIEEDEATLAGAKKRKEQAQARVKDIEYKLKNAKSLREAELKEAEKQCAATKKALEESDAKTRAKEQDVESARLEIEVLEKEIENYNRQIEAAEANIKKFEEELQQLNSVFQECQAVRKEAQEALDAQKERLKACTQDLDAKVTEHRDLVQEGNAADLKMQQLSHDMGKCKKEAGESTKLVDDMIASYEWITDEKKYFGQPNTAYDFAVNNPKQAQKRIHKLEETRDKLSKNVNMRAMNLLGKAEEQYADLMEKRKIVLSDKAKIAAVISELDEKKNEALKKAHAQVNKDFGSIFSMLLPGTQAKLVAIKDSKGTLNGLEIRVAFGDVWKESLQELSGGQRSLVALSLILALLLFKPAPLYILDEVDAALDSSHTQNIGRMLRTHFQHSQFIVVSLKDGMFNNANVLFKTKFVDGVSTVARFSQSQCAKSPINIVPSVEEKGTKRAKRS